MDWIHTLFGFHGRINRKAFWFGIFAITAINVFFLSLISYLTWGDAFPIRYWSLENSSIIFVLVMSGEAILAWPWTALVIKRLNDCDYSRPAWAPIWSIYIVAWAWLFCWIKVLMGDWGVGNIAYIAAGAFIVLRLGVLRGSAGPNSHTEDALPSH
jgi:uncharacterized membrane protein YhaH (DUF805 family)